jgi:hypothetical protein
MKKILSFAVILLMLASAFTCRKEDEKEEKSILGTTWKFVGYVDIQTGVLKEIVPREGHFDVETGLLTDGDPIDCGKCYTLTFTEEVVEGWSILNAVNMIFFDEIKISLTNIHFSKKPSVGGTQIGESPEPTLYRNTLSELTSYVYDGEKLKLFYNEDRNYMLFKLIRS